MDDNGTPFDRISSPTLPENIIVQIKKSIMDGVYRPGDRLPHERELLKRFAVSRNSLREALRALEQMGLIEIRRGALGGAYVRQREINFLASALLDSMRMAEVGFDEISKVRLFIEPGMARLAAEERDEADLEAIENAISLRERALKEGKIPVVVNVDFHQAVARASKNRMVCVIIDAVASALHEEFKKIALSFRDHRSIIRFHKLIAQAIRDGDGELAFRYMAEHMSDVTPRLKTLTTK